MDLNREVWSNAALALRVCWFEGIWDFCFGSIFLGVGDGWGKKNMIIFLTNLIRKELA